MRHTHTHTKTLLWVLCIAFFSSSLLCVMVFLAPVFICCGNAVLFCSEMFGSCREKRKQKSLPLLIKKKKNLFCPRLKMYEERAEVLERIYILKKEFCNIVKSLNGVTFCCAGKTTPGGGQAAADKNGLTGQETTKLPNTNIRQETAIKCHHVLSAPSLSLRSSVVRHNDI